MVSGQEKGLVLALLILGATFNEYDASMSFVDTRQEVPL